MGHTRLRFEHNEDHDIFIIYTSMVIDDEDDCRDFLARYTDYLEPLGRRLDAIFVTEEFALDVAIADRWAECRAELFTKYLRFTVAVRSNIEFAIDIATRAIRLQETVPYAPDIETAIVLIAHMRAQAGR